MILSIDTNKIKEWVLNNNIEKRSIDNFWKYIDYYINEVDDNASNILKSIDLSLISVTLYKVSLSVIYHYTDTINVFLNINFKEDYIGRYEVIYTVKGDYSDDFLNLEDINYISKLSAIDDKNIEIAQEAIKEGLDFQLISRITGLNIERVSELKKEE